MRKWMLVPLLFAVLLSPLAASAVGVGGYAQTSLGTLNWNFDPDLPGVGGDDSADLLAGGFGFLLDTNCAKRTLLNYRLSAGVEWTSLNFDDAGDGTLAGLTVDNTLGFGLATNAQMRFWLGPDVRLGYHWGDVGLLNDVAVAEVGIGPVAGMNLHFGRFWDLALSLGVRWSLWRGDDGDADVDIDGDGLSATFRIGILRRGLDDTYLP
jgi:hypothetical protein